jgi:hypothetical protein
MKETLAIRINRSAEFCVCENQKRPEQGIGQPPLAGDIRSQEELI